MRWPVLRSAWILGMLCWMSISVAQPDITTESAMFERSSAEPEVVCSDIAPYVFIEHGQYHGYAYEIGQEVMRRLGYRGAIHVQPLARAIRTVQTGHQVIALWVGRIPERERTLRWIYPVVLDDFSLYTLAGKPAALTLEQAKAIGVLGANIGAANAIAAKRKGLVRMEMISSDDANGRKLLAGHIQGWIAAHPAVNFFLGRHGMPESALVKGVKLIDYQAWVAASPDLAPAVFTQWHAALQAMADDGTLQRLADKYRVRR